MRTVVRRTGPLLAAALAAATLAPAAARAGGTAAAGHRPAPLTLAAVGDVILGNTPQLPAHPRHYLHGIRHPLTAGRDVVFANLEGTLTDSTASKCSRTSSGCYAFRNPPSYADVLADVGFTVVSDANNHSHDFGDAGLVDTVHALDAAGVRHTGLPGQIAYQRAHGIRVGVVAFAPYPTTADLLDLDAAAHLVRHAQAHADVVVVYMHAGAEGTDAAHVTRHEEHYLGEDRGNPFRFAHRMVRAGADLVIGSGPHVLRGMQFYRGRLIAYSLGNSANYHNFDISGTLGDSVVLRVALARSGRFRTGRLVPVRLVDAGRPVVGGDALATVRQLSREDFGAHRARIGRHGRISPPA